MAFEFGIWCERSDPCRLPVAGAQNGLSAPGNNRDLRFDMQVREDFFSAYRMLYVRLASAVMAAGPKNGFPGTTCLGCRATN
jgi:hypothetical protein